MISRIIPAVPLISQADLEAIPAPALPTAQPELQIVNESGGGHPVKPGQDAIKVFDDPSALAMDCDRIVRAEVHKAHFTRVQIVLHENIIRTLGQTSTRKSVEIAT